MTQASLSVLSKKKDRKVSESLADAINDESSANRRQRVWLVTGASRGLGAQIVEEALKRGDKVAALAREPRDVLTRFGVATDTLLALACDVTDERQTQRAVDDAYGHFGRLDVVVNNAGYGIVGAIEETTADEVRAIFDTNVFGLLNVTRAVLPYLRAQRQGHVINMSSLAGYKASPGFGIYGATKFAVEAISEALSAELGPLGIHVTVVEPGYFRTDFTDETSLKAAKQAFDDYQPTAGKTRSAAREVNHKQPNDPRKLAEAMFTLIESTAPPLRLALGRDAVARIRDKHSLVEKEMTKWVSLSYSTGYPL